MSTARIRQAHAGDAAALHEVHSAVWREAYTGLVADDIFAEREVSGLARWEERLTDLGGPSVWLAHREGEAVGFAWAEAAGPGHLRPLTLEAIYVRAGEYGSGTAANLLLLAIGDAPCLLWTARDNPRAIAFYRKHGFTADGTGRTVSEWGNLPVLRMVR